MRLLDHGGNRAPLLPSTEILYLPFKTAENNNKNESQQDCRTSWQCFKSLPLWLGHAEFRLQTTVHVSHDNRGVKPHLKFHRRGRQHGFKQTRNNMWFFPAHLFFPQSFLDLSMPTSPLYTRKWAVAGGSVGVSARSWL